MSHVHQRSISATTQNYSSALFAPWGYSIKVYTNASNVKHIDDVLSIGKALPIQGNGLE